MPGAEHSGWPFPSDGTFTLLKIACYTTDQFLSRWVIRYKPGQEDLAWMAAMDAQYFYGIAAQLDPMREQNTDNLSPPNLPTNFVNFYNKFAFFMREKLFSSLCTATIQRRNVTTFEVRFSHNDTAETDRATIKDHLKDLETTLNSFLRTFAIPPKDRTVRVDFDKMTITLSSEKPKSWINTALFAAIQILLRKFADNSRKTALSQEDSSSENSADICATQVRQADLLNLFRMQYVIPANGTPDVTAEQKAEENLIECRMQ